MIIPDLSVILTYVLNGIFALVIFFFVVRPIMRTIIHSFGKMAGVEAELLVNNEKEGEKVDYKEQEKLRKMDEMKQKNAAIHEQAEKEVEEMENRVISKLFEGKPIK